MASSEEPSRSPRRRPRSPGSDDDPEPAKARRRHDSPVEAGHRHQGHGNTDHDDDHRIQQLDEEAAGVNVPASNANRDEQHRNSEPRSSTPDHIRSQSRERQQDGRAPDAATHADGHAADGNGVRQRDRATDSLGTDRERHAAMDRGDRDRDGSRRSADRWGSDTYSKEDAPEARQRNQKPDDEVVRKGRGFASRRGDAGGSRRSRSRSRDRYRRESDRYDSRDRDRREEHDRDRYTDRGFSSRDRDRYERYGDRGDRRREQYSNHRERDHPGHPRDDDRRGSSRDERGSLARGEGERGGRDSRDDRDAGRGVAAPPAAADKEQQGAAAGPAPAENGAAGAPGDEKEAAEFLKKKAANSGRAGGAYIPPFRLARMMAEIDDKNSVAAQKLSWEALRKSLNGLINKVNAPNIKEILPELFQENLMRGRGLFCQAIMKAQLASPTFSPLYAALVSVVNTKFPELGELLCHRVLAQFKRAFKRNDKPITIAAAKFVAHLINQGVLHEVLALEVLILLLENPSDDSVEMAVEFCKEVGAFLQDVAPAGLHSVFERFRAILHEGAIDKRCQYMIEGLFAVRKAGFEASGHAAVKPELDLVEDEDQITHEMSLDDKHDPQAILNVFREDPEYELHEQQYKAIVKEILGEESEGEGAEGEEGSDDEGSDEDDEDDGGAGQQEIEDATGTDVVNLRRTIYLTIMSSLDFEEAGHKLMKIHLAPGQECEIPIMIIECCSQEKTFVRYYALLGARFCLLRKEFQATFEDCFAKQYAIIHRLETNKLRNVAKLFAHLLSVDAISWGVLQCIRLTEDDTTSSSRIFIKYLFQELSEYLGLSKLNERLAEPSLQEYFSGIFPTDSMANMRFGINFFTSIGLGGITDCQRELYKQMPRIMAERRAAEEAAQAAAGGGSSSGGTTSSSSSGTTSSSSSGSSSSDSSSSSSDSESEDSRDRRRRRRR